MSKWLVCLVFVISLSGCALAPADPEKPVGVGTKTDDYRPSPCAVKAMAGGRDAAPCVPFRVQAGPPTI